MYRFFSIILVCCLVLICSGCTTTAQTSEIQNSETHSNDVRIYEVFGMDCPGCHSGLEKLVNKIPAIQSSQANWKDKQLSIAVNPGSSLDDQNVYDAIRRGNFTPGKRLE